MKDEKLGQQRRTASKVGDALPANCDPKRLSALPPEAQDALVRYQDGAPTVVSVGTFDGVHDGHRDLIAAARQLAEADGMRTVAVTFWPRPDQVFRPQEALPEICSLPERITRLMDAGADSVVVVPFSRELSAVSAEDFVGALEDTLTMRVLCVGEDFALGRSRAGTPAALRGLGVRVETISTRPSRSTAMKASSSHARKLIASGLGPDLALSLA